MKKLIIFAALILVVAFISVDVAVAETNTTYLATVSDSDVAAFVEQLCQLNGSGNTSDTRNFIANSMRNALGEHTNIDSDVSPQSNVHLNYFVYNNTSYYNIEATITATHSTDKTIVIGAHYDALGEGASDNACGVAALYITAITLKQNQDKLPFNVKLIAFDCEEYGMVGSQMYVNSLSEDQKSNILVMFNMDAIALGDNVYVMCENKHTDLANLILSNSSDIIEKPYARGVVGGIDAFGYGYFEDIQGSDQTPFRLAGIPTAILFSGTYSYNVWGYSESSNPNSWVMNTTSDTYQNLVSSGVDYVGRIRQVSQAVSNTILSDDFVAVAQNARSQLVNLNLWYNEWWPILVAVIILIVLAVLTWWYYRKLQKKSLLGTASAKPTQGVFDKPDAEDIFTFKDDANKQKNSEIEDIFSFKK